MAIHSVCPACRAEYDLADHLGGQRVVCRQCRKEFDVPRPAAEGVPSDGVTTVAGPPARAGVVRYPPRTRAPRREEYEEDGDDRLDRRPRREAPLGLIVGAVVGVLLLLLCAAGLGLFLLRSAPAGQPVAQPADQAAVKGPPPPPRGRGAGPMAPGVPPLNNEADPQAQWDRGNFLFSRRQFEEAAAAYREAVRLKPDFPEAHANLAVALATEGHHKGAEAALREVIRLQPDSGPAHLNLGRELLQQFRHKEAEAAFREAIRLQPGNALAICNLGIALQNQGRLTEALEELRRGDAMGRQLRGWGFPSRPWVEQCERFIEEDRKLPAVLAGDARPAGAVECADLVNLCVVQKRLTVAAARFAAQASPDDPELTPDLRFICFYNGACGAALAAGGQGEDAKRLPDKVVVMLRRQALGWLREELAEQEKRNEAGAAEDVRRQMRHWQQDPDLVAVRDPQALAALPEQEQQEWRRLWADVEALLKKAATPK